MKKFAFIIDTYPSSKSEIRNLLDNIRKIKKEGIDVILTSHHHLTKELIEAADYFLFEKKNDFHFLESEILNSKSLGTLPDSFFQSYHSVLDEVYINGIIHTSWSVGITSQFFNAIKFAHSKGYEFAFYLVSDFKFPKSGFRSKIDEIFKRMGEERNYFIQHYPSFWRWYAPFFFGFTIDDKLVNSIPNLDFSDIEVYQNYFCNCAFENVILNVFGRDNNLLDPHDKLDYIFDDHKNWNIKKSFEKVGDISELVYSCYSDIYVNEQHDNPDLQGSKYSLYLYNGSSFREISIKIEIFDDSGNRIYGGIRNLLCGTFYREYIDLYLEGRNSIRLEKEISVVDDESIYIKDSINIDTENINYYKKLKYFRKN